jgi:hypothetical protein
MSSISILGDTSGSVLIQAPSVAGSTTVNIGATTGTIQAGAPAFSAYSSNSQSFSSGTPAKIQYNVKDWDTNNCYDSTTNYRFTPNVAGYYQFNITATVATASITSELSIWKNGAVFAYGPYPNTTSSQPTWTSMNCLIFCNGTTDYVEAYLTVFGATDTWQSSQYAKFQGFWVRGA